MHPTHFAGLFEAAHTKEGRYALGGCLWQQTGRCPRRGTGTGWARGQLDPMLPPTPSPARAQLSWGGRAKTVFQTQCLQLNKHFGAHVRTHNVTYGRMRTCGYLKELYCPRTFQAWRKPAVLTGLLVSGNYPQVTCCSSVVTTHRLHSTGQW